MTNFNYDSLKIKEQEKQKNTTKMTLKERKASNILAGIEFVTALLTSAAISDILFEIEEVLVEAAKDLTSFMFGHLSFLRCCYEVQGSYFNHL